MYTTRDRLEEESDGVYTHPINRLAGYDLGGLLGVKDQAAGTFPLNRLRKLLED